MADTLTLDPEAEDQDAPVRFVASDVRRMLDAGILDDDSRYEVIDGEIIAVQAHNPPHMRVKRWILSELFHQIGQTHWIDSEASFYIVPDGDYTLPDIIVYPRTFEAHRVRGADALLVIEVADKTLKKDRGKKARLYARHGVRDYWVVNAQTLVTYRYAAPQDGAFAAETEHGPEEAITPALLPGVSLRMADVEQ